MRLLLIIAGTGGFASMIRHSRHMYRNLAFLPLMLFFMCSIPANAVENNPAAQQCSLPTHRATESMQCKIEPTEKGSVLPGPLEGERLGLYTEIHQAQHEGIGVSGYITHFLSMEDAVKQGEPEIGIRQRLSSLRSALHEQIQNKRTIRMRVIPKTVQAVKPVSALQGVVPLLKFDGFYVCNEAGSGYPNYSILRFYPNGEVVSASVLDKESKNLTETLSHVKVWLTNKMTKDPLGESSLGTYQSTPDSLHFNCGRVEYDGVVADGDKLVLEVTSHINGYHSFRNVYEYVRVP
jgi:hypothetical protein